MFRWIGLVSNYVLCGELERGLIDRTNECLFFVTFEEEKPGALTGFFVGNRGLGVTLQQSEIYQIKN